MIVIGTMPMKSPSSQTSQEGDKQTSCKQTTEYIWVTFLELEKDRRRICMEQARCRDVNRLQAAKHMFVTLRRRRGDVALAKRANVAAAVDAACTINGLFKRGLRINCFNLGVYFKIKHFKEIQDINETKTYNFKNCQFIKKRETFCSFSKVYI